MLRITVQHVVVPAAFSILASGCYEDERLTRICPATCYSGPEGTEGVGACTPGVPVCDEDGFIIECVGGFYGEREKCDGIDNDCDGDIDEFLSISPYEPDNRCKQCGKCRQTREVCDNGIWTCEYDDPPAADDATCDGVDDDCDCEEDEDHRSNHELVFCYEGPDDTVVHGECRPGVEKCENGYLRCDGQVLPTNESCNGVDDDCNGWVDDVSDFYQGIDLIFGIDTSGSMGPYIEAATNVVCDYAAATESRDDLVVKMGLVLIATPDGEYSLTQNLTDAQTLCEVLQNVSTSGGSEPTISAAEAVSDPTNPLLIDWSPASKRIFIGFGDEQAQVSCPDTDGVVSLPCDPDTATTNTLAYCTESGTDIYWFVGGELDFYVEQAVGCGGEIFQLTSYEQWMTDDLNTILEEVCLEDNVP